MSDKMSAERELEEQLKEAGGKLRQPPSSLEELLPLLDQVENFLSRVEQSPAKSMQAALSPLTNALVTDELLRHADVDVKVAVASCISEITRITAPDTPYDDDKMKDVFQLIVSSFEGLSDESNRSYNKRAMILETVAKVRSCVVMLDLECDGLIAEMFQLFLGNIRDFHPENIFSSMDTIMTLLLEESEDISPEILTLLLATVKRDNQEVLPVAVKLAEKVFENCAVKLTPYLSQTIKSLGVSLGDYSEVITALCGGSYSTVEHTNKKASTGQLVAQDVNGACPEDVNHDVNRSLKSVTVNGGDDIGSDNKGAGTEAQSSGNAKENDLDDEPAAGKVSMGPEVADSDIRKPLMLESKLEAADLKRDQKPAINVSESSDTSHIDGEEEVGKLSDLQESQGQDLHGSPQEKVSAEASKYLEKGTATSLFSPKVSETEAANTASASPSGSYDEGRPRKASHVKKKELSIQAEIPSSEFASKKASEGRNDSEAKLHRRSGKKAPVHTAYEDKMSGGGDTSENEGGGKSDTEIKQMKQLSKKVDESSNAEDEYSLKRSGNSKKRGRGKAAPVNEVTKDSAKDDIKQIQKSPSRSTKDEDSPEETLRMSAKRQRIPGTDKVTGSLAYGDNLVGLKVKVWWPQDREFYEGVIDSFDPVKKKHKVSYVDGDEEILNLKRERWELVDDDLVISEEQAAETASPDAASGMQKRQKARRNPESSAKQGKKEVSPKSGAASSGKLKGTAVKSGRKTEDDEKLKDRTSMSGGKTEDDSTGKAKPHSQRTGDKHVDDFSRTSVKSKEVDSSTPKVRSKQDTPKTGSKLKKDTPKAGIKSKGKTPLQTGGDSSANGMTKIKHSSSKATQAGDLKEKSKEKSTVGPKTPEGLKAKLSDVSKVQENQIGSVKKRRRAG
ncbi:hypothetical protein ACH5RR_040020 [Cinchona calisaya]|uniref:Uncharacterized protein n=1 Tax=Cinchona calisaya TaxID=153742 RepID=A0ABD2Y4X7_9GENT